MFTGALLMGSPPKIYATFDPANKGSITLSNGNLTASIAVATNATVVATIGKSSGKWYWEYTHASGSSNLPGVWKSGNVATYLGATATGWSFNSNNGRKINNTTQTIYGNSYTTQKIGVALDMDNGAVYFSIDNVWQNSGDPTSGASKTGAAFSLTGTIYPAWGASFSAGAVTANFGATALTYTPPAGYNAGVF